MAAEIRIVIGQESKGSGIAETKRDIDDLDRQMQATSKSGGAFGDILTGAFHAIGAAALNAAVGGLQALGGAMMQGIDDARESIRLNAATEQTIKTMGNVAGVTAAHVADFAASLSDAAGKSLFGDNQIQEASNLLLTFGNIKGATLDLATVLTTDLAQALGGDPKQQAMMLGKALNDPIAGIGALGKAGLTFSEEQKAMIASLVQTGDMAGAQNIIIAELNKQVGGQAQAAAQAAGGWVQFQARMGEAMESIGSALLPILNRFAGFMNDTVAPAVEALATWLGTNLPRGIAILEGAWTNIQPFFQTIAGLFTQASTQAGGFSGALQQLGSVWTTIQGVIDTVVPPIRDLVMGVFSQIQLFLNTHGEDIKAFLGSTWDRIKEIIGIAAELVKATIVPIFQTIAGFLKQHGGEIQAVLGAAWNIIKSVINIALGIIKGVLKTALALIKGDWQGAWDAIKTMVSTVWENIKTIFRNQLVIVQTIFLGAWETIKAKFQAILDSIVGWVVQTFEGVKGAILKAVDGLKSAAGNVAQGIVSGIVGGIKDGAGKIVSAAKDAAMAALNAAKSALGIGSPSRVFAEGIGLPIAQGMAVGMMRGAPLVAQAGDMTAGAATAGARERVYNQQRSLVYSPTYNNIASADPAMDAAFARSLAGM